MSRSKRRNYPPYYEDSFYGNTELTDEQEADAWSRATSMYNNKTKNYNNYNYDYSGRWTSFPKDESDHSYYGKDPLTLQEIFNGIQMYPSGFLARRKLGSRLLVLSLAGTRHVKVLTALGKHELMEIKDVYPFIR